jgi:hypothetical protein
MKMNTPTPKEQLTQSEFDNILKNLKELSKINNIIYVRYPCTSVQIDENFQMFRDFSKSEVPEFKSFGTTAIEELQGMNDIISEGLVQINDKDIVIKNDSITSKILLADKRNIEDTYPESEPELGEAIFSFEVSKEDIQKFKNSVSVLSELQNDSNDFFMSESQGEVVLSLSDFKIYKTSILSTKKPVTASIISDNLNFIPEKDYLITVYENKVKFETPETDGLRIYVERNK